ncbi:ActS/PrrB/RegB family redox-sensitive histidine kinase [Maritalea porphyrae]|jgi:two-component system sensor histidine kinase RegB|uniref:ActS/PrrB/RegB family redox-sensitive histidine kinase n=1 Tax=Maritalea porphyrae TaxID=880732 RepID=UPI0022AF5991|nr:ActS/PrrB/RegB family redox-sensitive histidine kinase [Maritalea porphyrae]MCZ4272143.1 ActS/PrrB/RegB family redox-sensitive histidine kinase [Maritalea porphyrae]
MSVFAATKIGSHHRLRLETLVRLRWLAVGGQSVGVLLVAFALNYELPLGACFTLIALSAWLNVILLIKYPANYRLRSHYAAAMLAYDCMQLGGLLYLTGGLSNPFAILLLAPISVSATTLPFRWTVGLSVLVVGIATALGFFHFPLPWDPQTPVQFPNLYTFGVWVGIVCGVSFISAYTNRVAHEARQLADALSATELVLARETHITALDGLAAAAAHELGTPLATIALAGKEALSDLSDKESVKQDLELISEQAARCRTILQKLRNLNAGEDPFSELTLSDFVAEVVEPHRFFGIEIVINKKGEGSEPLIARNAGLNYGLGNFIENAVDFAQQVVTIDLVWSKDQVLINITDDGAGFAPEMLVRLGEPYLTSRPKDDLIDNDPTEPGGLGLGVFIAKTLLERSGAQVGFANLNPNGHACVNIRWRRQVIEIEKSDKVPAGEMR